jgi:hypothetical protein
VARTPDKLRNLLTSAHFIPSSTLDSALTIIAGNVKSVEDVKKAIISPTSPTHVVDTIVFGVGGAPRLNWSLSQPCTNDDPHICESGMSTVLTAITILAEEGISTTASGGKPVVVTISTTGISEGQRDVPTRMWPLYHWALSLPHLDKQRMEQLIFAAAKDGRIADFVIVRPTILTDGEARGLDKVRVGWEWGIRGVEGREKEHGPELGYSVGRIDVGQWIFQEAVKKGGWGGKCATLTY